MKNTVHRTIYAAATTSDAVVMECVYQWRSIATVPNIVQMDQMRNADLSPIREFIRKIYIFYKY